MIGFLRGIVDSTTQDTCFIDCNGVGYRVFIPQSTQTTLIVGQSARLYTYLHVREDAMLLYGFSTREEYELYTILLNVNGVGPKLALAVISSTGPSEFRRAVASQNICALTAIPGVGKKTAERMIVELKDKIMASFCEEPLMSDRLGGNGFGNVSEDALQALVALGYSRAEVAAVLRKIPADLGLEEIIRQALKQFLSKS